MEWKEQVDLIASSLLFSADIGVADKAHVLKSISTVVPSIPETPDTRALVTLLLNCVANNVAVEFSETVGESDFQLRAYCMSRCAMLSDGFLWREFEVCADLVYAAYVGNIAAALDFTLVLCVGHKKGKIGSLASRRLLQQFLSFVHVGVSGPLGEYEMRTLSIIELFNE